MTDFLTDRNMILLNDSHETFQNTRNQKSAIDWTMVTSNLEENVFGWRVNEDLEMLSDHLPITFEISLGVMEEPKKQPRRKWHAAQWDLIKQDLEPQLINLAERDINSSQDVEQLAEDLDKVCQASIAARVPVTICRRKRNYWWNAELQAKKTELKKRKRRKEDTREIRLEYEQAIQDAKRKSWKRFLEMAGKNEAFIRYKVLCKMGGSTQITPLLRDTGIPTRTPEETAQLLLEKSFPDLDEEYSSLQRRIVEKVDNYFLNDNHTEAEPEITREEIQHSIDTFQPNKQPGIDKIPAKFYQNLSDIIIPVLQTLYNGCLKHSVFPSLWKTGEVIFICKPNKPAEDPKSYRPITLLPIISKILEKIVNRRLKYFAKKMSWLDERQMGFQAGIGAEDAAFKLANSINRGFKLKQETLSIFLDITGAFNDLWIDALLHQLIVKKCPATYLYWLRAYLSGRTARHRETGASKSLTKSVPQGAVLSPFLWNVFFDSMLSLLKKKGINVQAFADDCCISITGTNRKTLERKMNQCLQLIQTWAKTYKITFNAKKTQGVLFSRTRKKNLVSPKLGDEPIEIVPEQKYLGITFDRKLTWKSHVAQMTSRVKQLIQATKRGVSSKWGMKKEAVKFIYENALRPVMLYGAVVWGKTTTQAATIRRLEQAQRQALLISTGCLRTTSGDALQVLAGIPSIHLKIQEKMMTHMNRILANEDTAKRLNMRSFSTQVIQPSSRRSNVQ